MNESPVNIALPDETVMNKIFVIRDFKVMLDRDLAELYGVETKVLKQSVRRNLSRSPPDFMFEMSPQEFEEWRDEFATPADKKGLRYAPFCFTEQGVAMLSSILNSERAIQVNIRIIRVFIRMRELLSTQKDLTIRIEHAEYKLANHDDKIHLIFEYLRQLEQSRQEKTETKKREPPGFKSGTGQGNGS
ncbi:MAG: ORF6N domain-containing protein [Bacteroidota bacterium]